MDYKDERTMSKFGTIYNNKCTFALEDLVSDDIEQPKETNLFYELFL